MPRHVGPLVVCFAVALAMMAPYAGERLFDSAGGDLYIHVSCVADARNALLEGQFPLRVAPTHDGGFGGTPLGSVRVPLFQFYGNFPYTLGGLLALATGNPYTAWKIVLLLSLTGGGFFTYLSAYAATRRRRASVVASVVFMAAPYMGADLHARFAFTEIVAFNLLPAVLYFVDRAFGTREPRYVILGGVAWALLSLSHNVAYLYASAYFGLHVLLRTCRPWDVRYLRRATRVGVGYALGVLLVLWYIVPQLRTVDLLAIGSGGGTPVGAEFLTPLHVLLAPELTVPAGVKESPRLGLQVGWVVLAAALLAAATLPLRGRRDRARGARLLVLFAVAFFMAWSPVNFWGYLPPQFTYVQSTYRLLMFVTLFGALLVPHALRAFRPRGHAAERGRDLSFVATAALLVLVAAAAWSYVPQHKILGAAYLPRLLAKPGVNVIRDYMLTAPAALRTSPTRPDVEWGEPIRGVLPRDGKLNEPTHTYLRAPRGGGVVTLRGTSATPVKFSVVLDDRVLRSAPLPAGDFALDLPYAGPLSDDVVRLLLAPEGEGVEVTVRSLRVTASPGTPVETKALPFVSASDAVKDTRQGRAMRYTRSAGQAGLLELPVLYYPDLLRVTHDGQQIPYGNVGRLLAVNAPAGPYSVRVTFAGVRWANVASGVAWAGVGVVLMVWTSRGARLMTARARAWLTALSRGRLADRGISESNPFRLQDPSGRSRSHRDDRPRGARGVLPIAARFVAWPAFAAIPAAILIAQPMHRVMTDPMLRPFTCTATASRPSEHPVRDALANAFDADDATVWSVPGGGTPVTLTLDLPKRTKLGRVQLLARQTGLNECWRHVDLELSSRGTVVLAQSFELPHADIEALQVLTFNATRADRVTLRFSDPVTVLRDGVTRVDPNACSPGYREIRID